MIAEIKHALGIEGRVQLSEILNAIHALKNKEGRISSDGRNEIEALNGLAAFAPLRCPAHSPIVRTRGRNVFERAILDGGKAVYCRKDFCLMQAKVSGMEYTEDVLFYKLHGKTHTFYLEEVGNAGWEWRLEEPPI